MSQPVFAVAFYFSIPLSSIEFENSPGKASIWPLAHQNLKYLYGICIIYNVLLGKIIKTIESDIIKHR